MAQILVFVLFKVYWDMLTILVMPCSPDVFLFEGSPLSVFFVGLGVESSLATTFLPSPCPPPCWNVVVPSHLDNNGAEYTILGSKFLSFDVENIVMWFAVSL